MANLVNEAALLAARAGNRMVTMNEFESAKDKVMMGPERRSMVMSDKEKRLTAYHEHVGVIKDAFAGKGTHVVDIDGVGTPAEVFARIVAALPAAAAAATSRGPPSGDPSRRTQARRPRSP